MFYKYIYNIYIYICIYIYNIYHIIYRERKRETEQFRTEKTLVNTTNFPTSFAVAVLKGFYVFYDFLNRRYIIWRHLVTLTSYIWSICREKEQWWTEEARKVMELILVVLSNNSLYLSVFVLEPLLMYSLYCSIV